MITFVMNLENSRREKAKTSRGLGMQFEVEALGSISRTTLKKRHMETETANVTEMGGVKDRNNDRDGGRQGARRNKKGSIRHSSLRALQGRNTLLWNRIKVHRTSSSSPT